MALSSHPALLDPEFSLEPVLQPTVNSPVNPGSGPSQVFPKKCPGPSHWLLRLLFPVMLSCDWNTAVLKAVSLWYHELTFCPRLPASPRPAPWLRDPWLHCRASLHRGPPGPPPRCPSRHKDWGAVRAPPAVLRRAPPGPGSAGRGAGLSGAGWCWRAPRSAPLQSLPPVAAHPASPCSRLLRPHGPTSCPSRGPQVETRGQPHHGAHGRRVLPLGPPGQGLVLRRCCIPGVDRVGQLAPDVRGPADPRVLSGPPHG